MQHFTLIRYLTLAGVLPMIGLAVLSHRHFYWAQSLLDAYVFGIVVFMLGALWGEARHNQSKDLSVLSNILFFAALIAFYLFSGAYWLMAAAFLLIAILFVELRLVVSSSEYLQLRVQITTLASGSLFIIAMVNLFT